MEATFKKIAVNKIEYQTEYKRIQALQDMDLYNKEVQELAKNIQEVGLMNPITVIPHPSKKEFFLVKAGNRRLQAVKEVLKWREVMCGVFPDDNIMLTLAENLQRVDITLIEKGQWINQYIEIEESTQKEPKREETIAKIASSIGKAPRTIYDWSKAAREATPEDLARVKAGETSSSSVRKSKVKSGSKKENPGQQIKKNGKAFITLSDKIVEKLKFLGSNAVEYKNDKQIIASFKRLQKAAAIVQKHLG